MCIGSMDLKTRQRADPMDYSLAGSSVHGILQVRILEWVAIPFSRGSSQPRDQTCISCIAGGFPGGSEVKVSACNAGYLGSIPGSRRCPGEGNGNPFQYSFLENPMEGGAW